MDINVGDIIFVNEIKNMNNNDIPPHPFIVTENAAGIIAGLPYDISSFMLTSVKNKAQYEKYKKYDVNMFLDKTTGVKINSFLKLNELYYFKAEDINGFNIGKIDDKTMDSIAEKILELSKDNKIKFNTNNLKEKTIEEEKELEQDEEIEI